MLDTCIVMWLLDEADFDLAEDTAIRILDDNTELYVSVDTLMELVIQINHHKSITKVYSTLDSIMQYLSGFNIHYLDVTKLDVIQYGYLLPNIEMKHKDPWDHMIICQAITRKLLLYSTDTKFDYYRGQGLKLIKCNPIKL